MSLGDFATWLDASTTTATRVLTDLGISFVRIGARGQYRISVASVAHAFDVPLNDDDGTVVETDIAKHRLTTAAVVNAVPPLRGEVQHVSG
jgi:hypothetical protein